MLWILFRGTVMEFLFFATSDNFVLNAVSCCYVGCWIECHIVFILDLTRRARFLIERFLPLKHSNTLFEFQFEYSIRIPSFPGGRESGLFLFLPPCKLDKKHVSRVAEQETYKTYTSRFCRQLGEQRIVVLSFIFMKESKFYENSK